MWICSDNIRHASLLSVPMSGVSQGEFAIRATKYKKHMHQGVYLFIASLHFTLKISVTGALFSN